LAKRSNLVQSVIRALDILETIDAYGELGISEISDKLNLDKSTVHRIISTLRHKGYVVQNNTDHKYSNSIKLWEMGNNVVERLGVRRQAQPFMERLVIESCETVNLAIMDGRHAIYIDKIESNEIIKADLNVGKRLPCYCTGLGKAMLAFMPEERVKDLLQDEKFFKYTGKTVNNLQELFKQLEEIRQNGYCIDDEEYVEGIKCIASPVMNYTNDVVAAISIAIPKFRIDSGERDEEYIAGLVKTAAVELSEQLGFRR
jgi:IclR family KDG regulon transcriptional repressor